jgi:hypothetical protein
MKPSLHPMNGLAMPSKDSFIEIIEANEDQMIVGPAPDTRQLIGHYIHSKEAGDVPTHGLHAIGHN